MAKVFMLTAAELDQLVETLELTKLRMTDNSLSSQKTAIEDMHRSFHYQVVRWVQDVAGHKGK